MASIAFTPHLRAVGPVAPARYDGETLAALLAAVDRDYPRLRGYIFDDQGQLRRHVAVFVDGMMRDRETALDLALTEASDVYIFQALSGG